MPLPKPKTDESQQDFMERCMADDTMTSEYPRSDQRMAVCTSQFGVNAEVRLKPPKAVRDNYAKGLELHEEGKTGDGIEPGTIKVAKDIVSGEAVTEDWVGKANRFWDRNERFLDEEKDSPAYASALLWGGAAGRDWYRSVQKKLEGNSMQANRAGDKVRANIRSVVNSEMIRREQRDGRDVVVVKSATLPDDIVMNGILYPAEEIEASYKSLEGTPAPLGHPTVNNMFVSAKTPLGLNLGYFGAWNANVQRQNGRVLIEKVVDVERANESKMGRRVLAALEQGKPIHTSTGLTMNLRECTRSDLADLEGYNMEFDHDAILLDEEGAATPEDGVGMLVNRAEGENGTSINVVNGDVSEKYDEHIDMLGMELLAAMDRKESASRWERVKGAVMEAFGLMREEIGNQRKEATIMAEKEEDTMSGEIKKLNERMDRLEERLGSMEESIKNMGDKQEKANAALEAINAKAEADRAELVNKVVEAKLLDEDTAKDTPDAALNAMLNSSRKEPTPAPGIWGGFAAHNNNTDNVAQFATMDFGEKKEA